MASDDAGAEQMAQGKRVTENIVLCPDGKYRWVYEFSMLRNPVILLTIVKIFVAIFAVIFLLIAIGPVMDGNTNGLWDEMKILLIFFVFFMGLVCVAYLIVAAQYKWKYMVLFEMDENGIVHLQMPEQFEKAKAVAWLSMASGIATGNIGQVGQGMMIAENDRRISTFQAVRRVKSIRSMHTIKVDQPLSHNQVYADGEDFDFVLNYIKEHVDSESFGMFAYFRPRK